MRYVIARWRIADRQEACRIYFADALKAIADNTANLAGGGTTLKDRLVNLMYDDLLPPEDTRTQDEIVADIWAKIGQ